MLRIILRRYTTIFLILLLLIAAGGFAGGTSIADEQEEPPAPAYFLMGFDNGQEHTFALKLSDPARIAEARALIGDKTKLVIGTIVKAPALYNPDWSYHLEPASITFGEAAIEVCDASPDYVEEHLAEVGGAFLPDNVWCPWNSYLAAEMEPPPVTQTYLPLVRQSVSSN